MDKNLHIKNEREYIFKVILINNDNPTPAVLEFNPNLIEELVIEENFFHWFTQGHMTYVNYDEGLERDTQFSNEVEIPFLAQNYMYKYRFDCYDTLIISIQPNPDKIDKNIQRPLEEFLLEFKFAIYDVQDIPAADNEKKKKKIYFWELDYQMMLDKNLSWSTAMHPKFINLSKSQKMQLTNYERSIRCDEILEMFLEDENICNFKDRIDRDNWRQTDPNYRMFYTSPSQNFLSDDLDTLITNAVADEFYDYSPMIFSKGRTTETQKDGKFTLLPIAEFYARSQNPKDKFMENMFIQYKGYTSIIPLKSPDYESYNESVILSYQYAQAAGIDNSRAYQHKPQVHYSHGSGQFNWDSTWHTPVIAKNFMVDKMSTNLKQLGDPQKNILVLLNQYKKEAAYTLRPDYSDKPTRESRLITGRNKIIQSMMQLNDTINFFVKGMTFRTTGKFIGIDLRTGIDNMDFDNRLLGQWFVVKVSHIFKSSVYLNEMTCLKLHSYQNLRPLNENLNPDDLNVPGWQESQ